MPLQFQGLTISAVETDSENNDDLVIFIDTDELRDGRKVRIRINDALIFAGTPGLGTERVESDRYDGFYIVQDEN